MSQNFTCNPLYDIADAIAGSGGGDAHAHDDRDLANARGDLATAYEDWANAPISIPVAGRDGSVVVRRSEVDLVLTEGERVVIVLKNGREFETSLPADHALDLVYTKPKYGILGVNHGGGVTQRVIYRLPR